MLLHMIKKRFHLIHLFLCFTLFIFFNEANNNHDLQ
jgi:hypothetical protein